LGEGIEASHVATFDVHDGGGVFGPDGVGERCHNLRRGRGKAVLSLESDDAVVIEATGGIDTLHDEVRVRVTVMI
jgi:hypothetical protein